MIRLDQRPVADSSVDPASQGLAVHGELFVLDKRIIGKPENFYGKIAEFCQIAEKRRQMRLVVGFMRNRTGRNWFAGLADLLRNQLRLTRKSFCYQAVTVCIIGCVGLLFEFIIGKLCRRSFCYWRL